MYAYIAVFVDRPMLNRYDLSALVFIFPAKWTLRLNVQIKRDFESDAVFQKRIN